MTQLINSPILTIQSTGLVPSIKIGIKIAAPVLTIHTVGNNIKTAFMSVTPSLSSRVATDSVFVVKYFGEEIDSLTTSNIVFEYDSDGESVPFSVSANVYSGGINTFTIIPSSDLTINTPYTITLLTTITANGVAINQRDLMFWTSFVAAVDTSTDITGTVNDVFYKKNLVSELLDVREIVETSEKFNYGIAPSEYEPIEKTYSYETDDTKRLTFDLKSYFKVKVKNQFLAGYDTFFENLLSFGNLSDADFKDLERALYPRSYDLSTSAGLLKRIKFILDIYAKAAGYHFVVVDPHPHDEFVYYITTDIPRDYWSGTLKNLLHPLSWQENYISVPTYHVTYDEWAASTAYTVGDRIMTADWALECTTAGTSGSGDEPIWNNYIEAAADIYDIDGSDGLIWTCIETINNIHNYQIEKYQWEDTYLDEFRDFFGIKGEDRALTVSSVSTDTQVLIRGSDNIYLIPATTVLPPRMVRTIGDWAYDRVIEGCYVYLNGTLSSNDGEYEVENVEINSEVIADDCADDSTANWTAEDANISMLFDTDHYEITGDAANKYITLSNILIKNGRSYSVAVNVKDGTASGATFKFRFYDSAEQLGDLKTTTSSWNTEQSIFIAATDSVSGSIGIEVIGDYGSDNIEIKSFTVTELSQVEMISANDFITTETITISDTLGIGSYLNFNLNNEAKDESENGIYVEGFLRPDPDTAEVINDPAHALYDADAISSDYPFTTVDNWAKAPYEKYDAWTASKYQRVGDKIIADYIIWICTIGGTTNSTVPLWSTTFIYEETVVDGTVTWSAYEEIKTDRRDLLNILNHLQLKPKFILSYLEVILTEAGSQLSQIIYGASGFADANVCELELVRGSSSKTFFNQGEDITFLYVTEANPTIFIESTTFSTSEFSYGNTDLENDERHNVVSDGNTWDVLSISAAYDYYGGSNTQWQDIVFYSSVSTTELAEIDIGQQISLQGSLPINVNNSGLQYVYRTDPNNRTMIIRNIVVGGGVAQSSSVQGDLTGMHRITAMYNMETFVVPGLFSFDKALFAGLNRLVEANAIDPADYKAVNAWRYNYWDYTATCDYADIGSAGYAAFVADIASNSYFSYKITNTNYDTSNIIYKSYRYDLQSVPDSWEVGDYIYEYETAGDGVLFGRVEAVNSEVVAMDTCSTDLTPDWTSTGTLTFDDVNYHYEYEINGTTNTECNLTYLTFVAGKTYQFTCQVKNGTASGKTLDFVYYDGVSQNSANLVTSTVWQTLTADFVAASSTVAGTGGIRIAEDLSGNDIEIKNFRIDNVTDNTCVMCFFDGETDFDDTKYYSAESSLTENEMPEDFIAHYTMDNIVTTTLYDETTNSYDATLINSPTQVTGYMDNALDFDNAVDNALTMTWDTTTAPNANVAMNPVWIDRCATDSTADWDSNYNATVTFDTDHYVITATSDGTAFPRRTITLIEGHWYRFTVDVKDGSDPSIPVKAWFWTDGGGGSGALVTSDNYWQSGSYSLIVPAHTVTAQLGLMVDFTTTGQTVEIRNYYVEDITSTNGEIVKAKSTTYTGYRFDGSRSSINCGSLAAIDDIFDGGGSYFVRFNAFSDGQTYGRFFEKLGMCYIYGGKITYTHAFSGNAGGWTLVSAISFDEIKSFAITYDADSDLNDPIFYINGVSVAITESSIPSGTRTSDAAQQLMLGNNLATSRTFDGEMYEVSMYGSELTAQNISDLHGSSTTPATLSAVAAWEPGGDIANATWTDSIGSSDGTVVHATPIEMASAWDAGASSSQTYTERNLRFEFNFGSGNWYRAIGLTNDNPGVYVFNDIDFCFYERENNQLSIYENGVGKASWWSGEYAPLEDHNPFVIEVINNTVKYYADGGSTLLYTSETAPTWPLMVDCAIHYQLDSFNSIAVSEEGSASYVDCTTAMGTALDDDCNSVGVSFWVKADTTQNNDGLFYIGDFSSSDGEFKVSIENNNVVFELSNAAFSESTPFTETSNWHHIFAQYTGYKAQLFIDNVLYIDGFHSTNLNLNGLKTILGAAYNTMFTFNGLMDQVKIFNRPLSTTEVAALYNETVEGVLGDSGAIGLDMTDVQSYDRKVEVFYNIPDLEEYDWATTPSTSDVANNNHYTFFGISGTTYAVNVNVNVFSWKTDLTLTTTDALYFDAFAGSVRRVTGSWITDGVTIGSIVHIDGTTSRANRGYFKVESIQTDVSVNDTLVFEDVLMQDENLPLGLPLNTYESGKIIRAWDRIYYNITPTSLNSL